MPIYEYCCSKCGKIFEEIVSLSQGREVICPACGSKKTKRVLSTFATTGSPKTSGSLSCGTGPTGFS